MLIFITEGITDTTFISTLLSRECFGSFTHLKTGGDGSYKDANDNLAFFFPRTASLEAGSSKLKSHTTYELVFQMTSNTEKIFPDNHYDCFLTILLDTDNKSQSSIDKDIKSIEIAIKKSGYRGYFKILLVERELEHRFIAGIIEEYSDPKLYRRYSSMSPSSIAKILDPKKYFFAALKKDYAGATQTIASNYGIKIDINRACSRSPSFGRFIGHINSILS